MVSDSKSVIVKFCDHHGLDYEIVSRSRHKAAIISYGGRRHTFTFSDHAGGERRAPLNLVAQMRRKLGVQGGVIRP